AELPKIGRRESKIIKSDDRSVLAESVRILRTNLSYIQNTKNTTSRNNLIFITSSVPGEGKTFLSSNLAVVFASTGKKVLLIGADIRNPKLFDFFSDVNIKKTGKSEPKQSNHNGLTEYLVNPTL